MENPENLGIDSAQARALVDKYIINQITKYHLLETEAIMRALADYFNGKEQATAAKIKVDEWGTIGLLHDIDWDLTKSNPKDHLIKAPVILKEVGASDFLITTILSHGYGHPDCGAPQDKIRTTRIEHALAAVETLTGLIVASALVQPDKKLASVDLTSLKKKFKSKNFAANCSREIILECEQIGITLDEFLTVGLQALQRIASDIGL